jgi:hypothetical protein
VSSFSFSFGHGDPGLIPNIVSLNQAASVNRQSGLLAVDHERKRSRRRLAHQQAAFQVSEPEFKTLQQGVLALVQPACQGSAKT